MRAMKPFVSILCAAALLAGCEAADSKLSSAKGMNVPPPAAGAGPTTGTPPAPQQMADAAPTGSLEQRVAKLEATNKKYAEALDFLEKVYNQQKQQQEAQERDEPAPDAIFAVDVADDIKAGQFEGPANAPVTIVEAFDFACPYCRKVSDTLESLEKSYNGKVRIVFKNMVVHPQVATTAHLASCAAAKQGKYAQFKNEFWIKGFDVYAAKRDQSKLGEDNVLAIAAAAGFNMDKFKADMKSDECKKVIDADMAELAKFKVNSTPTLYVNGTHVGGALPESAFKQLIDDKLKVVEASGVASADYYDKEIMGKGEHQFRSKMDPKTN
jgi:protein-disulfide isomerase